ncbi:MAG TPA: TIGR02281 family clan AA aspartic protease [Rhizomicrobium sp.]
MSHERDPWRRDAAPPPHPARVYLWFGLLLAIGVGVWALFKLFPEVNLSEMDTAWLVRLTAVLALAMSGLVFARQFRLRESLRNIAIWVAIAAVLALGYSFRDVLGEAGSRVRGEFLPTEPRAAGDGAVVLSETENGDYQATGEVNGVRVRFAIDTGASDIVLSREDATRAGIDTAALAYTRETGTANGIGHGAETVVDSLALGPIAFEHVRVMVNDAPLGTSLLGMAFLRRLKSFEFKDHKLYLRRD